MIFTYKLGFYSSFDKNNQKWNSIDNKEDENMKKLNEKYKDYLSGSGLLPNAFFHNFVLIDILDVQTIQISHRLNKNLPSLSKFISRVKKFDKSLNDEDIQNYWKEMKELLEIFSNDTDNIWCLIYKYE